MLDAECSCVRNICTAGPQTGRVNRPVRAPSVLPGPTHVDGTLASGTEIESGLQRRGVL